MANLLFRTRVAVLWLAVAGAAAYSVVMYMVGPGALEEMLGGNVEGDPLDSFGVQAFTAAIVIVPMVMVAVTLLVADRFNHYLNLVLGGLFGLLGASVATLEALDGGVNGHIVMVAVAGILSFLIAGLGVAALRHPLGDKTPPVVHATRHRTGTAV